MFNKTTWKYGEKLTYDYMKKKGYKIVYTNFSCPVAELDIVAIFPKKLQIKNLKKELKEKLKNSKNKKQKENFKISYKNIIRNINDLLVITEVKARVNDNFGYGYDAIDLKKRQHLIRGAKYLTKDKRFSNLQVRFDVASIDNGKITYIENAFAL